MISLAEIDLAANKFQVPAEAIEKDYIISWILACLAKSKIKDQFIFYGGTALKRIYFEDHRFSEDIDLLSSASFDLDTILEALGSLEFARTAVNLDLSINPKRIIQTKDRVQLYVDYSGYEEIIGAPKEVRIDFSMNMDLYGKIKEKELIKSYSDLNNQQGRLYVMSLNTILANKLGLLIDLTRNEPRDLYDIWFLLKRSQDFDFNFEQICETFKNKYGFQPSFNILTARFENRSLKDNWNSRLQKQVAELTDIKKVISDVTSNLEDLFSSRKN